MTPASNPLMPTPYGAPAAPPVLAPAPPLHQRPASERGATPISRSISISLPISATSSARSGGAPRRSGLGQSVSGKIKESRLAAEQRLTSQLPPHVVAAASRAAAAAAADAAAADDDADDGKSSDGAPAAASSPPRAHACDAPPTSRVTFGARPSHLAETPVRPTAASRAARAEREARRRGGGAAPSLNEVEISGGEVEISGGEVEPASERARSYELDDEMYDLVDLVSQIDEMDGDGRALTRSERSAQLGQLANPALTAVAATTDGSGKPPTPPPRQRRGGPAPRPPAAAGSPAREAGAKGPSPRSLAASDGVRVPSVAAMTVAASAARATLLAASASEHTAASDGGWAGESGGGRTGGGAVRAGVQDEADDPTKLLLLIDEMDEMDARGDASHASGGSAGYRRRGAGRSGRVRGAAASAAGDRVRYTTAACPDHRKGGQPRRPLGDNPSPSDRALPHRSHALTYF